MKKLANVPYVIACIPVLDINKFNGLRFLQDKNIAGVGVSVHKCCERRCQSPQSFFSSSHTLDQRLKLCPINSEGDITQLTKARVCCNNFLSSISYAAQINRFQIGNNGSVESGSINCEQNAKNPSHHRYCIGSSVDKISKRLVWGHGNSSIM